MLEAVPKLTPDDRFVLSGMAFALGPQFARYEPNAAELAVSLKDTGD